MEPTKPEEPVPYLNPLIEKHRLADQDESEVATAAIHNSDADTGATDIFKYIETSTILILTFLLTFERKPINDLTYDDIVKMQNNTSVMHILLYICYIPFIVL
jgi:hypothetical protein